MNVEKILRKFLENFRYTEWNLQKTWKKNWKNLLLKIFEEISDLL